MSAMASTASLQGDEEFEEYNPQAKLIKTLEVICFCNLYISFLFFIIIFKYLYKSIYMINTIYTIYIKL